jgi:thioredoxin reductase
MAAALLLDQSGFETHLFEARPATGGGIVASASPPGKGKLFWYSTYLANRLEDSGVALHLGARIQPDDVVALSPDIAIVATGTSRIDLPIAGIDHPMVMDAYDLLMGDKAIGLPQGSHVLVYGGGETGCESAEFCAEMGFKVTLVSRSSADKLARSADAVYRGPLLRRLHSNPQVTIVDSCHVVGISDSGVLLEISGGDGPHTCTVDVDKVLLAQGRQPASAFAGKLEQAGIAISVVGDSKQMGRIGDAVHMAYKAVMALSAQHSAMAEPLGC